VAHIQAGVAEWEAAVVSSRTSEALAAKRSQGKAICRPSVVDDEGLVMKIKDLRESGLSLQKVADELNRLSVPTLPGGVCWRPSSVQNVLGYRRPRKAHKAADLPEIKRRRRAA
jgi:hypothetical protein